MIIDPQNMTAVRKSVRTVMMESLRKSERSYDAFSMEVPSSSSHEYYAWLKALPGIRKWVGDRVIRNLEVGGYNIANEPFESTFSVPLAAIERDAIGVFKPMFEEVGRKSAIHRDVLTGALIKNGHTQLCFDGQYFFDTDHPVAGGTASNKFTLALTEDNFEAVRGDMRSLKDEDGESLRITPDVLFCDPKLEGKARRIVVAQTGAAGATNVNAGAASVVVVDELSNTGRWGLFDTKKALKPFIYQVEKAFQFVAKDQPNDDHVFNTGHAVYGIDGRFGSGYGFWQLAAISAAAW